MELYYLVILGGNLNNMENFEYYLEKQLIRKVSPNLERAKSLIKDGEERIKSSSLLEIEKFSKIIFENIYDALRDFCDSILLIEGYKSYSHEASISYLLKKGFDISVVKRLDGFRYRRNGSKYYGEFISSEEAKDIKVFYLEIKEKLYSFLKQINKNG